MSDRPFECTECKKPVFITYVEVVGSTITRTIMCAECPSYHKRIHGSSEQASNESNEKSATGLCCGNCSTTLASVRMGHPLGCAECYSVFSDIIVQEMHTTNRLPNKLATTSTISTPMHIGRAPGESTEINPSLRLISLHEALKETLSREDYEQAAWLRDQIKQIKGGSSDSGKQ